MNSEVFYPRIHKEAKDYELTVTFCGAKLNVLLKDYSEWMIYEKDFTEEDIGKEIHRKLELIDVYSSFCDNGKIDDETKIEAEEKDREMAQNYGYILIRQNGKDKYKIQRCGKITTYTQVLLRRNGEQVEVSYESTLQLKKIQKMSEIQMVVAKSEWEKIQIVKKFGNKIQELSNQNSDLKQRIAVLQRDYKLISNKCQKLSQMVYQIEKQQNQELDSCKKEIKSMKKMNQNVKLEVSSPFYNKFVVNKREITYIGENCTFTQFFIKQELKYEEVVTFKIRIVKSTTKNLMIGICDVGKQLNSRSSYSSNNAYLFYGPGGNGYKYPGSILEGKGYQVGDIVEVCVNLAGKSISWSINGVYNAGFKDQESLCDRSRKFMPCIELYDQNECVEWLGISE